MTDYVPMTRAGYERIKTEVDRLNNEEMPKIAEKIAAAREEGDLKENAEYHANRENQGMLQAKINLVKSKLSRAFIIDPSTIDQSTVSFFATVTVMDVDLEEEEVYTLVGAGEEDFMENKVLVDGPMAQALLGKKVGDVVEIDAPKGSYELKVMKIEYDFDD